MADLPKNVANGKFFWTLRGLNIPETVCDLFLSFFGRFVAPKFVSILQEAL